MTLTYTAIAIANTLVMATADRAREIAVWRLVGASRRQVVALIVLGDPIVSPRMGVKCRSSICAGAGGQSIGLEHAGFAHLGADESADHVIPTAEASTCRPRRQTVLDRREQHVHMSHRVTEGASQVVV